MKLLHTSDWHLGKTVYGRNCHAEFTSFLEWLLKSISEHHIECLLVAGDIFDNTTPAHATLNLYYSFLHSLSQTSCRHVVITGGNHDSASLLNAPRKLLQHLNIHVVGSVTGSPGDEVLTLSDGSDNIELIVCAVPYLRDRDIRRAEAGEAVEEKAGKLLQGIMGHYEEVITLANTIQDSLAQPVPLVAMGHLFTTGGKVGATDELRDLYVGNLVHIPDTTFPENLDYVALGHLHSPQVVNKRENIRYCGAPLHFSFSGARSPKMVSIVELSPAFSHTPLQVPDFLDLQSIEGSHEELLEQLDSAIMAAKPVLLEVIYQDNGAPHHRQELVDRISESEVEILRIINRSVSQAIFSDAEQHPTLEDLSEVEVFQKCMESHGIAEEKRPQLEECFLEILVQVNEEDEE